MSTRRDDVIVRCTPADELMVMQIRFSEKASISLTRKKLEPVSQLLNRLRLKLKLTPEERCGIYCCDTQREIAETTTNEKALLETNFLALGCRSLPCRLNIPTVVSLTFDVYSIVGCPILPLLSLEFATESDCKWTWYRIKDQQEEIVSITKVFTPSLKDIDCTIAVECSPVNSFGVRGFPMRFSHELVQGKTKSAGKSKNLKYPPFFVVDIPLHKEIIDRHSASQTEKTGFRILTYNILLDAFCDNEWALKNIYPYVEQPFADVNLRKQLILREVMGYNADIMCFQEVSQSLFQMYLMPNLILQEFDGRYGNKISQQPFGSAVFVRSSSFEIEADIVLDLTTCWKRHHRICAITSLFPSLGSQLEVTTTTAQILLLGKKRQILDADDGELQKDAATGSGSQLCVANVHLYSNPEAPHIRALQAAMVLNEMEIRFPGVAVIFCGDFNAEPSSGVCEFLAQGAISTAHPEWAEGALFGHLKSTTQSDREANWHAVMKMKDIALARRLFAHLDCSCGNDTSPGLSGKIVSEVREMDATNHELPQPSGQVDVARLKGFLHDEDGDLAAPLASLLQPLLGATYPPVVSAAETKEGSTECAVATVGPVGPHGAAPRTHTPLLIYADFYAWFASIRRDHPDLLPLVITLVEQKLSREDGTSNVSLMSACYDSQSPPDATEAVGYTTESAPLFACGNLTHNYELASARPNAEVSHCAGVPLESSVLDHIFFDRKRLALCSEQLRNISMAAVENGIPSAHFPSDHTALVADLEFQE